MVFEQPNEDDVDFEIQFYEGIVQKEPAFFEALVALAHLYTLKGDVKKGLEMDIKLATIRPDDPIIHYNLACSYSLLDDVDNALRVIKVAIKKGYDDMKHLVEDSDLANLHDDKRFVKFMSNYLKKKSDPKKK